MRITFTGGTLVAGIAALTMTVISAGACELRTEG